MHLVHGAIDHSLHKTNYPEHIRNNSNDEPSRSKEAGECVENPRGIFEMFYNAERHNNIEGFQHIMWGRKEVGEYNLAFDSLII